MTLDEILGKSVCSYTSVLVERLIDSDLTESFRFTTSCTDVSEIASELDKFIVKLAHNRRMQIQLYETPLLSPDVVAFLTVEDYGKMLENKIPAKCPVILNSYNKTSIIVPIIYASIDRVEWFSGPFTFSAYINVHKKRPSLELRIRV